MRVRDLYLDTVPYVSACIIHTLNNHSPSTRRATTLGSDVASGCSNTDGGGASFDGASGIAGYTAPGPGPAVPAARRCCCSCWSMQLMVKGSHAMGPHLLPHVPLKWSYA